jgi:hypothetical protein
MTLSELINELTELMEEHGDIEVRTATQPNWPFEHHIAQIKVHSEIEEQLEEAKRDLRNAGDEEEREAIQEAIKELEYDEEYSRICYIVEGSQIGYVTKSLWD